MRANRYGVRGLKGSWINSRFLYFWAPPRSLQKAGIFKFKYLGADFENAAANACDWHLKVDANRVAADTALR